MFKVEPVIGLLEGERITEFVGKYMAESVIEIR